MFVLAGLAAFGLAPAAWGQGDANEGSCPNAGLEGFSARLPDCRAYEQVTPAYKQGYPVNLVAVSADGSQVYGRSLASLAGTEGAPQSRGSVGLLYRFSRTPAGWATAALTPSNPEFRSAATLDSVSGDASRALFRMPTGPVGQDDYYVREPDGGLVDVGPATPPEDGPTVEPAPEGVPLSVSQAVGASTDFSHVVFALTSPFGWPGDDTFPGAANIYEYSATGSSIPTMVAVSGGPGSTTPIDRCGVSLGGPPFTTRYNAVSASGDVIVFTPADELPCDPSQPVHAELDARIDASRTLQLSAKQCDAEECPVSTPSAAVFSGASGDGRRGWFLSTQRLTRDAVDDATPGDTASAMTGGGCQAAAGSGCNLYEYDLTRPEGELLRAVSVGSPVPHVQGVVRISTDGSHVYFVATGALSALPGPLGAEPREGAENLYVSETVGEEATKLRFVAALSPQDGALWGEAAGSDEARPADVTPDGAQLVFASRADLTADDTSSGVTQVFEYEDGPSPTLRRVSVGEEGFNEDGNTSTFSATVPAPDYEGRTWYQPQPRALDGGGGKIVFETEDPLVPGAGPAQAGAPKLYEYTDGHVYLIYAGSDTKSRLNGIDATGRDIFFQTDEPLVGTDTDTQTDIYDARVEGGTSRPSIATCAGETCLGPAPPPPAGPAWPGSALGSPDGNFPGRKPVVKAPSRAQKLSRALRACKRRHGRVRKSCERKARKRFGKVRA